MDEKIVAVKERATSQEITRKVAEALPKDVGRGLARLDPADMASMGIEPGDVIRLIGERETAAKAMSAFPGDRGRASCRSMG